MSINFNDHDITTSGNLTANSGNFTTLTINNSNFNSSVSGLLPTIANSGDNRILTSTGSTVGINAESNLSFDGSLLNVTGSGNFSSGLVISNQTASTVASFDTNKNVVSLSTSTYPSFTELSYLKGVTSSLQTQIDNKSSSTHVHGNISNGGAIGSTANLPLITTTSGLITVGSFGTSANTFCQGNDSRLSDNRTPSDGSVTTVKIVDSNVTYAKIQNVSATSRILGRSSSGAGIIEELDAATARTLLSVQPTASPTFTGSVGINVTPTQKLHVHEGSGADVYARITNTDSGSSTGLLLGLNGNEEGVIRVEVNKPLYIDTNNTTRLTISSTGTATFAGQIVGQAGAAISGAATFENSGNVVPLTVTNTGTANSFVVNDASGDTTPFVIDAAGRVGIGASPSSSGSSVFQARGDIDIHGNDADRSITYNMGVGDEGITGWYRSKIAFIPSSATNKVSQHIAFFNKDGDLGGSTLTERMRITTDGNVGIGTSSPQARLHVSSTNDGVQAIFTGAQTANTQSILFRSAYHTNNGTAGFANIGWIDNASQGGHLTFGTTSSNSGTTGTPTERMRITSAGDIGIGTSSVSSGFKVDIRGRLMSYTTASDGLIMTQGLQTASGGTGKAAIQIDVNGNGGFAWQNDASSGTRTLKLLENSGYGAGNTTLLTVQSGGNTGLGASPSNDYKLVIGGGTRTDSYTINPSLVAIKDFTNTNTGDNLASATYSYATTNGNYAIRNVAINTYFKINSGITNSGSSIGIANNNLRNYALTNDIGTLSALYGIYNQYGHYNTSAVSPVTTTAIGIQHLLWKATGTITNAFDIYCSDASSGATVTNRWGIYVEHTGKNYFGGNTGVGVSPTYRFEVRGSGATSSTVSFYISNSSGTALLYTRDDGAINTGTASVSPYNSLTSTAANVVVGSDGFLYRSTSSLRYKTNINDATHGLNEVLQLRSVTFKSHNDGDKIFGGLIAEEVDEIGLTEFVQYDNQNRPDAIHYSNMVSLLIKAIQEQQIMINNLKDRLSILEGN